MNKNVNTRNLFTLSTISTSFIIPHPLTFKKSASDQVQQYVLSRIKVVNKQDGLNIFVSHSLHCSRQCFKLVSKILKLVKSRFR